MKSIQSSQTEFEKRVFREIRKQGVRFRTHYEGVIGKPDIALPKMKKAVFLHSDFWHGWRFPSWEHILPSQFWKDKIRKNRTRDKKVVATLRRNGWKVMVLWEHSLRKDFENSVNEVVKFLKS